MGVEPGYKIGRDEHGLTSNEREVLKGLVHGKNLAKIGTEMELSRQRTAKLAQDLVGKGWLVPGTKRGQYLIEAKKVAVISAW